MPPKEAQRVVAGGKESMKELLFISSSLIISQLLQVKEKFLEIQGIVHQIAGQTKEPGFTQSRTQDSFWRPREGSLVV